MMNRVESYERAIRQERLDIATKAMNGILSNPEETGMAWDDVVKHSLLIADKMIEQIDKKEQ